MNKDELLNVLLNFYKSDENVILIDGKWGSGKTYLINEFIHNFNKLPVYYVSMLGSRNVNDINTNLYIEINKHSSINQIVPSSINPLKIKFNETTSLDFILKRNHDANAIIIFDDFERYSSSDYDSFLSYVSNLVLFKAKVIVVSNLKELGGGEKLIFDEFKEKIFDHIYKAELFTNNVIDIKLHEFSKFVKSDSLNILKSNIRLVDKLYFLLKSINKDNVFNYLNNEIKSEIIDISTVFLSIYYNQSKLNYSQEKLMRADINVSNFIKEYINDEDSYW